MSTLPIYEKQTRAGNPRNPAVALYSHWLSILRGVWDNSTSWPSGWTFWGESRHCGIGVVPPVSVPTDVHRREFGTPERPLLGFGYAGYGFQPLFRLNSKGQFQLSGSLHGLHQRGLIASNTFLDFSHFRGEYVWLVNTTKESTLYRRDTFTSWRAPVHYVGEKTVIGRGWSRIPVWFELKREGRQWRIVHNRVSELPVQNYYQNAISKDMAEAFEALRLKRYQLMYEEEMLRDGTFIRSGRKKIDTRETNARLNTQALAIAAHMTVTQPAKTTPLKRR